LKFTIGRIVGFVIFAGVTLFIGLLSAAVLSFSNSTLLYGKLLLPVLVLLLVCLSLWFFNIFTPKTRLVTFLIYVGCVATFVISSSLYSESVAKVETLHSSEVELSQYRPFFRTSKIARLEHTASWKVTGQPPRIDGATALYPLYSAFVEATFPEGDYGLDESIVQCNTTPNAYKRLINGEVDVVFCAQPSKEQLEAAQDSGVELVLTPIGREAFVFFVNAENRIDSLSSQQIKDIYSGKIRLWSQVGGALDFIRAYQRPIGSGSQTMLLKIMKPDLPQAPDTVDVAEGMGGIVTQVSEYKNFHSSIGFSFLFYMSQMVNDKKVKLLSIDGISPTAENIRNGKYKYSSEFYAVTTTKSTTRAAGLISWILSKEGQKLVEKTGYVPLGD